MNRNLQNKLSGFKATPPRAVWDKIVEVLDAEDKFPQRLFNYEEQAPIQVWQRLETALEETTPAKVIPFTTRFRRPIRYIAAASFITAILVATTLMIKRTEAGAIQPGSEATVPVKETPDIVADQVPVTQNSSPAQAVAAVQPKKADEPKTFVSSAKRILRFIKPQSVLGSISIGRKFIPKAVNKEELLNFSSLNNYMVYSDGDGHAMKLPKKLFSLVHCKDGDGSCKERIYQLQQKLSANAITADFTGILEMLHQLH
jgi:hypothetical protein